MPKESDKTMPEIEIKVKEYFDKASDSVQHAVVQCLEEMGQSAVKFTRDVTPVVTGRLKNSMNYVTRQNTKGHIYSDDNGKTFNGTLSVNADIGEVWFGTNVEYANKIENGTSKKAGRHMIKRAIDEHRTYYKAIMEKYLASALK